MFGLGAFHGINPGMGWLFAVALGLQERSRRAVLAALPPIALGHALSISAVVAVLLLARASVPGMALRVGAAAILFGFGCYRLFRSRHPGWVGMRVGFGDLTLWSFLMASAHGAGLMLVPVLLGLPPEGHAGHFHALPQGWLAAVAVHSAGHFLVATLVALLVYEKLGVAILRRAWFNLDLLWGAALVLSGVIVLVV